MPIIGTVIQRDLFTDKDRILLDFEGHAILQTVKFQFNDRVVYPKRPCTLNGPFWQSCIDFVMN